MLLGGAEAEQSNAANGSITWTSDRSGGCRAKSSPEAADLQNQEQARGAKQRYHACDPDITHTTA
eukprot:1451603-Amphidinium_carterae.1